MFLPPRVITKEEPRRSIWKSSNRFTIFVLMVIGWHCLLCFHCSHVVHNESLSNFCIGWPWTKSLVTNLLMFLKFKWESLSFYSQLKFGLTVNSKQIEGALVIGFISTRSISTFFFLILVKLLLYVYLKLHFLRQK